MLCSLTLCRMMSAVGICYSLMYLWSSKNKELKMCKCDHWFSSSINIMWDFSFAQFMIKTICVPISLSSVAYVQYSLTVWLCLNQMSAFVIGEAWNHMQEAHFEYQMCEFKAFLEWKIFFIYICKVFYEVMTVFYHFIFWWIDHEINRPFPLEGNLPEVCRCSYCMLLANAVS